MDTASLLESLENLCLEYRGLLLMAKDNDARWAARLHDYRKANRVRVAQQFDAARVELQKNPDSPDGMRLLAEILENTLVK